MTWKSGAFAGSPANVTSFGKWRGRPIDVAHAFAAGGTWTDIELSPTWLAWWKNAGYASRMVVSMPVLPKDTSTTIAKGASGSYDLHWKTAGQHLVAAGMGAAIIRVGWEFNGGWFRWAAKSNPDGYAAYFKRIVAALKSVSGQSFRIVWCPSAAYQGWDATAAYPGDASVDIVGVDQYDVWFNHPAATAAQRWTQILGPTNKGGLAFWAAFAETHGKPFALCEWGLVNKTAKMAGPSGGGGGDDPYYIQQIHDWLSGLPAVAYEAYLESNAPDGDHRLEGTEFPHAAATYLSLWGGTP